MNIIQIYVAIVVLAIAALLVFFAKAKSQATRLIPLAGLALVFVHAGVVFGENRFIGYGWMVVSVVVAIIEIPRKSTAA
jgi:hypothetical protein